MEEEPLNLLNNNEEFEPQKTSVRGLKAFYIFITAILAIIFFLAVQKLVSLAWPGYSAQNSITLQPKAGFFQSFKNLIFKPDAILEGQTDDRVNILVLGVGGVGHDGPFLSDTNIIASIKPSTKEVALISIPRDLSVTIPGHGIRKINSADSFGEAQMPGNGGDYAREIFAQTLGIKIPYYIRVDFKAFQDLVDAVGGIDVNVEKSFVDREFPGPNFSTRTIQYSAGLQTMDGATALDFARSRHGNNGESGDFARAHRQQIIINALKQKAMSVGTFANPLKIQSMLNALSAHVSTNLDFGQLLYIANIGKDMPAPARTLVLSDAPSGFLKSYIDPNTGSYLLGPKTGDFGSITNAIENIFSATSTPSVPENKSEPQTKTIDATITPAAPTTTHSFAALKVEIQNGTWQAGLAAKVRKQLNDQGFTVGAVGNALKRPQSTTMVYVFNTKADQKTVLAMAAFLHATATSVIPDWLSTSYDNAATDTNEAGMNKYAPNDDILIVLGQDSVSK